MDGDLFLFYSWEINAQRRTKIFPFFSRYYQPAAEADTKLFSEIDGAPSIGIVWILNAIFFAVLIRTWSASHPIGREVRRPSNSEKGSSSVCTFFVVESKLFENLNHVVYNLKMTNLKKKLRRKFEKRKCPNFQIFNRLLWEDDLGISHPMLFKISRNLKTLKKLAVANRHILALLLLCFFQVFFCFSLVMTCPQFPINKSYTSIHIWLLGQNHCCCFPLAVHVPLF
jgi:hypothetical protein